MSDGSDAFVGLIIIGGLVGAGIYINSNSTEQNIAYCHQAVACEQYSKARQDCAVAGNFQNCVTVKMGVTDVDVSYACTADGNVMYAPPDVPNIWVCKGINLAASWKNTSNKK